MEKITSFKQLRVWQKGIDIVKEVYFITQDFPKDELYGLTTQMRRAAISLPVNIAEGFKRAHSREYKQFLHIALGSAAELETQLRIANELKLLSAGDISRILEHLDYASKMISVLMSKLP